jgi:hypothetical protein
MFDRLVCLCQEQADDEQQPTGTSSSSTAAHGASQLRQRRELQTTSKAGSRAVHSEPEATLLSSGVAVVYVVTYNSYQLAYWQGMWM